MADEDDPKQLRVLKKLTALIEEINPDNGHTLDLRGKVFRGKSVVTAKEARYAISILEFPRQELYDPVGQHGICRQETIQLMLQGWPEDDPEHPSDPAYRLKAIVGKKLSEIIAEKPNGRGPVRPDIYMLGGDLTAFTIAPGVVRPPEDAISRLAMFYMPLLIGMKVDVADPYS